MELKFKTQDANLSLSDTLNKCAHLQEGKIIQDFKVTRTQKREIFDNLSKFQVERNQQTQQEKKLQEIEFMNTMQTLHKKRVEKEKRKMTVRKILRTEHE